MSRRSVAASWRKAWHQGLRRATREAARTLAPLAAKARSSVPPAAARPPPGPGEWLAGAAMGAGGMRRFHLFRPPDWRRGERWPLLVMLHGCGQDGGALARATRMNRLALRERCLVLYPEQGRLANAHNCWNWFETDAGRAQAEAALILGAIDQACLLHGADRARVLIAGLSAGASMAALMATRFPQRFRGVVMHAGVPPGQATTSVTALRAMRGQLVEPTPPPGVKAAWPPLLVIHGSEDRVVSPRNGQAAVALWTAMAGAGDTRVRRTQRGQRHPMTVTEHRRDGRPVATLVEVARLGHAWSGGAAGQPFSDPAGPDASRMLWRFAQSVFDPD